MSSTLSKIVAALVLVAWLVVAGLGGPYFGRLSEVTTQSATSFLPATAESTRVTELQQAFAQDSNPPAILVYHSPDGLSPETQAKLRDQLAAIAKLEGVQQTSPLIPSADRNAAGEPYALQAFVLLGGDPGDAVERIRALNREQVGNVEAYVTGPAGQLADIRDAFSGIDGILLLVAVLAVLLILIVVYRSPVLPFVVLFSAIAALAGAIVAVFYMAQAGVIKLDAQAQGILFILVIGAATDYSLLLTARYREALLENESSLKALRVAWLGSVEPVLASGGTVIAGLLCLLFSDLNSNKAVGPVAASGIVFALLSALTLLPALLALLGRRAFFPSAPRYHAAPSHGVGFWDGIGRAVANRPRVLWGATLAVLVVLALFVPQFRASGISQNDFILGASEARSGENVRAEYFVAGSGTPVIVMTSPEESDAVMAAVAKVPGVESVTPRAAGSGAPTRPGESAKPAVVTVDGRSWVELQATLSYSEDSEEALDTVRTLRTAVRAEDPGALVGGGSAANLDTRDTARSDLFKIIPIVLLVITVVLVLLLRSILAPVLLVASTVISYLATLGVSALVFNHIFHFPGADPSVPLFGFVFLVALGIDYNIFLSSRIREEALAHGSREGVLRGLRLTGNVITSAGVVLAATFAALAVLPIIFMAQIAFIVSFGVLLDTFVVRSLLVPGLLYDLGGAVWWPWRLRSDSGEREARVKAAEGEAH
jgi:RND superfamily putative drug exporter